jgi:polysaccharide biosynthesis protein PelA
MPEEASSLQLVIMDPDHHPPWSFTPSGCLRLSILSVGEAEDRRPYWSGISSASYLVEQNKESEGASVRVDFRDPRWRKLLLEQEIPRALAGGFQGFLLDTLDSVTYLEDKDPEKYAGSRKALAVWLAELRQTYPDVILLARGSEALEVAAPYVNGYVADGLFTTWDPLSRRVRKTTPEERDAQLDQVGNAVVLAARPIFTIEYADPR